MVPASPWIAYGWVGVLFDWIDEKDVQSGAGPAGYHPLPFHRSDVLSGHVLIQTFPVTNGTLKAPCRFFGYFPYKAGDGRREGYRLGRTAVDRPELCEALAANWGIEGTTAAFEPAGPFGFSVRGDGGRLKVSLEFRKLRSIGWFEKTISLLTSSKDGPLNWDVRLHGEAFLCRTRREGLWPRGRSLSVLLDRCWIELDAPKPKPSSQ